MQSDDGRFIAVMRLRESAVMDKATSPAVLHRSIVPFLKIMTAVVTRPGTSVVSNCCRCLSSSLNLILLHLSSVVRCDVRCYLFCLRSVVTLLPFLSSSVGIDRYHSCHWSVVTFLPFLSSVSFDVTAPVIGQV